MPQKRGKGEAAFDHHKRQAKSGSYVLIIYKNVNPYLKSIYNLQVYSICKIKTKNKASTNNNFRTTLGGPSQECCLSALEQMVAYLLHTEVDVNPPGDSLGAVDDNPHIMEPSGSLPPMINLSNVVAQQQKYSKKGDIRGSAIRIATITN